MKTTRSFVVASVLLAILLLQGCKTTTEVVKEPTATNIPPTETLTPTDTPPPTMTEDISIVKFTLPDKADLEAGLTLPTYFAGLTFSTVEGYWIVLEDGVAYKLTDNRDVVLSPFGTDILYSSDLSSSAILGGDIMMENLHAKDLEPKRLTNTADIVERGVQWWASNHTLIVFNYIPFVELGPWSGYLGAFDLTTGEYMVLDDTSGAFGTFALSPDGKTIVYDDGGSPMMYVIGEGAKSFNTESYGLNYIRYDSPQFSPDGKMLAFAVAGGGPSEVAYGRAVLVIDLENKTSSILHKFDSLGMRGGPELAWSPDGEWIASVNPGEASTMDTGPMALWMIKVDGSEEHFLGYGSSPRWSPDSRYLIFTDWSDSSPIEGGLMQGARNKVVDISNWELVEVDDLAGVRLGEWFDLDVEYIFDIDPKLLGDIYSIDIPPQNIYAFNCDNAGDKNTAADVACNVLDALESRNVSTLKNQMSDQFHIGYWLSEGVSGTPDEMIEQIKYLYNFNESDYIPRLNFITNREDFPPLAGMIPERMFGPDVNIVLVIYSEGGWGEDYQDSALLFIAQDEKGLYYWHGMVSGPRHFDK